MTGEDFVKIVNLQAAIGAADATLAALNAPPGRTPAPRDVELSDWYRGSSPECKAKIKSIIDEAVQQAVFSFLALLDGVAALGAEYESGRLLLFYAAGEKRALLNDPSEAELHNVFNRVSATAQPQVETKLNPYEVGPARSLLQQSVPGDGLEIHHAPDKHSSARMPQYDADTAPAIAIPKCEHRRVNR